MTTFDRVVMVVPTYNEAENLPILAARLRASVPSVDLLVVDDNSPDGTGKIAEELADEDPHISVSHRPSKAGLGAAYLHGFAVAMNRGYDVIGEMDADGSHQPEELPRLLTALASVDLVIGSRWVPGGSVVNWPTRRKILSRAGNWYARVALGVPVRDLTAGFRVFRRTTLERVQLTDVESTGYCFQADLAWRAISRGLTIAEVPIEFIERVRGESKLSGFVAVESIVLITKWAVQERLRRMRVALRVGTRRD